jgi:hypothetical protein
MKWKIGLARDMGQEAFVVIEAPTSEEAETILWHDMDPDVIRWSDDDVMGDRELGRSVRLTIKTSSPRSKCHRFRSPKTCAPIGSPGSSRSRRTRRSARRDKPASTRHDRARRLRRFRGLPVCRSALRTSSHDRPDPRRRLSFPPRRATRRAVRGPRGLLPQA